MQKNRNRLNRKPDVFESIHIRTVAIVQLRGGETAGTLTIGSNASMDLGAFAQRARKRPKHDLTKIKRGTRCEIGSQINTIF